MKDKTITAIQPIVIANKSVHTVCVIHHLRKSSLHTYVFWTAAVQWSMATGDQEPWSSIEVHHPTSFHALAATS
jgi:hypothetical protein